MASLIKTIRTLQASASNAAGSTATSGSWTQLSTAIGGTVNATVTNSATGPTVGCDCVVQTSLDGGTTWRDYSRQTAPTTASQATTFNVPISPGVPLARVVFTGNTGQAVTVEAFGAEETSIN